MSKGGLVVLLVSACSFDPGTSGAPGAEPTGAPLFHVPFPCGESWRASTRDEHDAPEAEVDWEQPPSAGKPVLASAAGTVAGSGTLQDGTSFVVIDHGGGWSTRYLHMEVDSLAPLGAEVGAGDPIGLVGDVGATGEAHLHYEQRFEGVPQPPRLEGEPLELRMRPDFAAHTSRTSCADPDLGLAARSDVDGDGHGDLVFHARDASSNGELWVWRGEPEGFDDAPIVPFTSSELMARASIAVADVDADGFADVALARPFAEGTTELHLLRGSAAPAGEGAYVRDVAIDFEVLELAAGDVTGDGFADLMVASNDPYELGSLRVYEGSEEGFASQPRVPYSGRFDMMEMRIAVADIDADGTDDILMARPGNAATTEIMLLPGGDALEGPGELVAVVDRPFREVQIAAGDVTGDRHGDLMVHTRDVGGWGTLRLWRGDGGGLAAAPDDVFVDQEDLGDLRMSVGDVTGDGRADITLVVSRGDTCDLRILVGAYSPRGGGVFIRSFDRSLDALRL